MPAPDRRTIKAMTIGRKIALVAVGLAASYPISAASDAGAGPWAILGMGTIAMIAASFVAPEYFGWREPRDGNKK